METLIFFPFSRAPGDFTYRLHIKPASRLLAFVTAGILKAGAGFAAPVHHKSGLFDRSKRCCIACRIAAFAPLCFALVLLCSSHVQANAQSDLPYEENSNDAKLVKAISRANDFARENADIVVAGPVFQQNGIRNQLAAERFLLTNSIRDFNAKSHGPFLAPNRLRKRSGVGGIEYDLQTGSTLITFDNAVGNKKTVDTYLGKKLLSRTYFEKDAEQPVYALYFGTPRPNQSADDNPIYRVNRNGLVDEVYQSEFPPVDTQGHINRVVNTIRILPANQKPRQSRDGSREWQSAEESLQANGAYRVSECFRRWNLMEFKIREEVKLQQLLWSTKFNYDVGGSLVGSQVTIYETQENANAAREGALRDIVVGWVKSDNQPPCLAGQIAALQPLLSSPDPALIVHPHPVTRETLVIQSTMKTSWNQTCQQFRIYNGENGSVFYEEGTEKRFNTNFFTDEPTEGFLLDADYHRMASFKGGHAAPRNSRLAPDSVSAQEVFTSDRVRMICEHARLTPDQFWKNLSRLGVNKTTHLTAVKYHPYLYKGSSRKNDIQYLETDADNARTMTRYLLPVDPPRSREIARVSGSGDFTVNFWWDETGQGSARPFGIVPRFMTILDQGRYYRLAQFQGSERLPRLAGLKDLRTRKALDKTPVGQSLLQLAGQQALVYRLQSNLPRDKETQILFASNGQIIAEDYEHETVQPFRGLLNVRSAYSGTERAYFDISRSWRHPLLSLLQPAGASPGEIGTVFRQARSVHFDHTDDVNGKQRTRLEFDEVDGLDDSVIHGYTAEYIDDDMDFVRRADLPRKWFEDMPGLRKLALLVGGLPLGVGVAGWCAGWLRQRRLRAAVADATQRASAN